MRGTVWARHALLTVAIRRSGRVDVLVECVVDTGFTGHLTLSASDVAALGLPSQGALQAELADGSTVELPVYEARVVWHQEEQAVPVLATGERPPLGLSLLEGSELRVRFEEGGSVVVDPLG